MKKKSQQFFYWKNQFKKIASTFSNLNFASNFFTYFKFTSIFLQKKILN